MVEAAKPRMMSRVRVSRTSHYYRLRQATLAIVSVRLFPRKSLTERIISSHTGEKGDRAAFKHRLLRDLETKRSSIPSPVPMHLNKTPQKPDLR